MFVGHLLGVDIDNVVFSKNVNSTSKWDYAHTKLEFIRHNELQHPGVIFQNIFRHKTLIGLLTTA